MQDALIQEEEEGQRMDKDKAAAKAAADREKKLRKKVCPCTLSHPPYPPCPIWPTPSCCCWMGPCVCSSVQVYYCHKLAVILCGSHAAVPWHACAIPADVPHQPDSCAPNTVIQAWCLTHKPADAPPDNINLTAVRLTLSHKHSCACLKHATMFFRQPFTAFLRQLIAVFFVNA